jgi:hypothetical protein
LLIRQLFHAKQTTFVTDYVKHVTELPNSYKIRYDSPH